MNNEKRNNEKQNSIFDIRNLLYSGSAFRIWYSAPARMSNEIFDIKNLIVGLSECRKTKKRKWIMKNELRKQK